MLIYWPVHEYLFVTENAFLEAVKLKSNDTLVHNNLGAALAAQENYEEAILQFKEAQRLDPDYKSAH
ncbi:MAG: tetratricopeptide repeat protein [Smithella sp.]